jgi:hypothetical protein
VGDVLAVARPSDLTLAISLAEEADRPRTWYGLAPSEPGPIRLIVVRGAGAADTLMGGRLPPWGAGFALPGARTIIIRADAGEPRQTLRHELAHLALHQAVRGRVPLWFDEGYAAVASGEIDRLVALQLSVAVARGKVPTLDELDRGLRSGRATAEASYGLAASAVLFLARGHPTGELRPLLERLGRGEPFPSAVLATTGRTLGRMEIAWQRDVRRRYGWIVWLTAGGFWLLVALLVIAAAWLRRVRDRPRRAALDAGWVVPPDADEVSGDEPDRPPDRLDPGQGAP